MPSQRKRIGFLPSEEVHDVIDKISKANKYSQSKVTGLLVEEALRSRGLVKSSFSSMISQDEPQDNTFERNNDTSNNFFPISEPSRYSNFSSINKNNFNEDLKMINEFIEYKLFKRIMNDNKNILDK